MSRPHTLWTLSWGGALVLALGLLGAAPWAGGAALGQALPTPTPDPTCALVPVGALPPGPAPIWCMPQPLPTGPATFVQGANTWDDEWMHGLTNADLGAGYAAFDAQQMPAAVGGAHSLHFRDNNHWMVDLSPDAFGAMIRPLRTFQADATGRLVVEADTAMGIQDYDGSSWPELVVTDAPAPTDRLANTLYASGQFKGHWVLSCRPHATARTTDCALNDPTAVTEGDAGRIWEISFFKDGGATTVVGGGPFTAETDQAFRTCAGTDPDLFCRDRFRMEITKDSVTLYVNGVLYMQHSGFPPANQVPDALLKAPVYVYFASWGYASDTAATRFHWRHLAVNPPGPPTAADGFGQPTPTPAPSPTATASARPTAATTPTPTVSATATATARPTATATVSPTNTARPTATSTSTPVATSTATPTPSPRRRPRRPRARPSRRPPPPHRCRPVPPRCCPRPPPPPPGCLDGTDHQRSAAGLQAAPGANPWRGCQRFAPGAFWGRAGVPFVPGGRDARVTGGPRRA